MSTVPTQQPGQAQEDSQTQAYRDLAASHIRDLSTLNAKLPLILRHTATTISQLTANPIRPSSVRHQPDTPAAREEVLKSSTREVATLVQDIRIALHGQIHALQQEKVIPAEQIRYAVQMPNQGQGPGQQAERPHDPEASVINGGMGNFDVGVLNARAAVGHGGDEDVLNRLKGILEALDKIKEENGDQNGEEMDTDG